MKNSMNSKRLNEIELQLTPNQWAIRVADEMRRHPSQDEFINTMLKGSYEESPFMTPMYALEKLAKAHHPKDQRREIELSRALRMQYKALESLIMSINQDILDKATTARRELALLNSTLGKLILQGALAFLNFNPMLLASTPELGRQHHALRLEESAANAAKLLAETRAYKGAVQVVQKDYFENHPILFNNIEAEFEMTLEMVAGVIAEFDNYRKTVAELASKIYDQGEQNTDLGRSVPSEPTNNSSSKIEDAENSKLGSIVETWVSDAKFNGTFNVLRESGKHQLFAWQQLRSRRKLPSNMIGL